MILYTKGMDLNIYMEEIFALSDSEIIEVIESETTKILDKNKTLSELLRERNTYGPVNDNDLEWLIDRTVISSSFYDIMNRVDMSDDYVVSLFMYYTVAIVSSIKTNSYFFEDVIRDKLLHLCDVGGSLLHGYDDSYSKFRFIVNNPSAYSLLLYFTYILDDDIEVVTGAFKEYRSMLNIFDLRETYGRGLLKEKLFALIPKQTARTINMHMKLAK